MALIESAIIFSFLLINILSIYKEMRKNCQPASLQSLFFPHLADIFFDQFRSVLQVKRKREGMSSLKPSWYSNVNPNVFISTVLIIGIFIAIVF